jgi:hypothetical protein
MFWIIDKQFDHMIFVCKQLITAGHMRPLYGHAAGKLYDLQLRVECTLFVIYKARCEPTPFWWYSWNIAESGVKHRKSNQIIKRLMTMRPDIKLKTTIPNTNTSSIWYKTDLENSQIYGFAVNWMRWLEQIDRYMQHFR